jgi:ATP-binding cassette subfamily A (ABC1) protein 3
MSVGSIFLLLESNKEVLGLECYSISISTLDEVFLKVVGKHGVDEENITVPQGRWRALLRGWECFERER